MVAVPPGNRNVVLIGLYFVWALVVLFVFEPGDGKWTPELIYAVSAFLVTNGATLVAAICGRALNKYVEKKGDHQ